MGEQQEGLHRVFLRGAARIPHRTLLLARSRALPAAQLNAHGAALAGRVNEKFSLAEILSHDCILRLDPLSRQWTPSLLRWITHPRIIFPFPSKVIINPQIIFFDSKYCNKVR